MGTHADFPGSQLELLIKAAQARHDADMFHQASLMSRDGVIEETLTMRAAELNKLAGQLEIQAADMALLADKKTR